MKRLRYEDGPIDAIDTRIVEALAVDGRVTTAALARKVGLSAPSVAERIKRLEEAGVIEGYAAQINPLALGYGLTAYLRIRPAPGELARVREILSAIPAITQCDRVTGEDCFIARLFLRSMDDLEEILDQIIPFAMTNTAIIQSSPVAHRLPPLSALDSIATTSKAVGGGEDAVAATRRNSSMP